MNPLRNEWQRKWLALDAHHPAVQTMADAAEAFCKRWVANRQEQTLLVLSGETGTGKTHTGRAIHRFCTQASMLAFEKGGWGAKQVPSTVFIAWPAAANEFNEKNFSAMDDACANDLVVLDDVGAENDPWKVCADKLCQILSRRENKFTVITTNLPVTAWAESFDVRISDRLMRNSIYVPLQGVPSYATRKH